MKNLHKKKSGIYEARITLNPMDRVIYRSLRTKDKDIAQKRLNELYSQMEREAAGVAIPLKIKQAAQTTIEKHLYAYMSDLCMTCSSDKYTQLTNDRIKLIFRECRWNKLADVNSADFLNWRSQQNKQAKTLNAFLSALNGFLKWLVANGFAETNPIAHVPRIPVRGRFKFQRRALTMDEACRLMAVVDDQRKAVYITAMFTGLRRNELTLLQWGDVHLDAPIPFITVRASTTKNGQTAQQDLHPDVITVLQSIRPHDVCSTLPVFTVPSIEQYKVDLKAAEIPYTDHSGRRADFHALRHTCGTNLAKSGVSPQAAKKIMRHSDMKLTTNIYTDTQLLETASAVHSLQSVLSRPQIRPQKSGPQGHSAAQDGTDGKMLRLPQPSDSEGDGHSLASTGTDGHTAHSGAGGGTRTLTVCTAGF